MQSDYTRVVNKMDPCRKRPLNTAVMGVLWFSHAYRIVELKAAACRFCVPEQVLISLKGEKAERLLNSGLRMFCQFQISFS